MKTPELYHFEKTFCKNAWNLCDTTYEIVLSLRDRYEYRDQWTKVKNGRASIYSLIVRVGVKVKVNAGAVYYPYYFNFYEAPDFVGPEDAARTIDNIRKDCNKAETKYIVKNKRKATPPNLGEEVNKAIKDFVYDRVTEAFTIDFTITYHTYDPTNHIEFVTADLNGAVVQAEYHFKSNDIDLKGQYHGNKIANIGFKIWRDGKLLQSFDPRGTTYVDSYEKWIRAMEEHSKGALLKENTMVNIQSQFNQVVFDDTEDFLKNHSHLTQFCYHEVIQARKDWNSEVVDITVNWSKAKADVLVKEYSDSRTRSDLGRYLISRGLVNEIKIVVKENGEAITDAYFKNSDVLLITRMALRDTPWIANNFKEALKAHLIKTFIEDVIRLPSNTAKVLNELNATTEQKKIVAKDFEEDEDEHLWEED